MGDEVKKRTYTATDFTKFNKNLKNETYMLDEILAPGNTQHQEPLIGFELEVWLVNNNHEPTPLNVLFLKHLDNGLVVPELSRFNIEINGSPTSLHGRAFTRLEDELQQTWMDCYNMAKSLDISIVTIGILPSVKAEMLSPENMSSMTRFFALNDQVMNLRAGKPFDIDIKGKDHYQCQAPNIMMEAAATSFQIHYQVQADMAPSTYNCSIIASAPLVAMSANSPFLFGKDLWAETRIPLFEQSVSISKDNFDRVTLGNGYVKDSLTSIFFENLNHYQTLIPELFDDPPEKLRHLRFHNGTIWRWNRPLIGFDYDGYPHLRIEHRCIPSGPTIRDCIANATFYFGIVSGLRKDADITEKIPFDIAYNNFYRAAKDGLDADLVWENNKTIKCDRLILDYLLPIAYQSLRDMNISTEELTKYLGIIESRIKSKRNGAQWQRLWVEKHGKDFQALTKSYIKNQYTGLPVHQWTI